MAHVNTKTIRSRCSVVLLCNPCRDSKLVSCETRHWQDYANRSTEPELLCQSHVQSTSNSSLYLMKYSCLLSVRSGRICYLNEIHCVLLLSWTCCTHISQIKQYILDIAKLILRTYYLAGRSFRWRTYFYGHDGINLLRLLECLAIPDMTLGKYVYLKGKTNIWFPLCTINLFFHEDLRTYA